jgi:hypothetical protein
VVEQRPFKPKVVGSIPTAPTNIFINVYRVFVVLQQVARERKYVAAQREPGPSQSKTNMTITGYASKANKCGVESLFKRSAILRRVGE